MEFFSKKDVDVDISKPTKEGCLEKQSKLLAIYRKRWVVLQDSSLYTFKEKNSYKNPTNVINLNEISVVDVNYYSPYVEFSFMLIDNDNDTRYWFKAYSEFDRNEWIKCINNVITRKPTKEGWLEKQSKFLAIYRKRWVVLRDSSLYTFKKNNSYKNPTIVINLNEISVVDVNYYSPYVEFSFMLINNDKNTRYWFKADSEFDRNEWIKCINNVITSSDSQSQHNWINCANNFISTFDIMQDNMNFDDTKQDDTRKEDIIKEQAIIKYNVNRYYHDVKEIINDYENIQQKINEGKQYTKKLVSSSIYGDNLCHRDNLLKTIAQLIPNVIFIENDTCNLSWNIEDFFALLNGNIDNNVKKNDLVLQLNNFNDIANTRNKTKEEQYEEILTDLIKEREQNYSYYNKNSILYNIKLKLANSHQTRINNIHIINMYHGTKNFVYNVDNLDITKAGDFINNLEKEFSEFRSLKLRHLFDEFPIFKKEMFDERGNKSFSYENNVYSIGPPGNKKPYIQPHGWIRFGLKVLGEYDDDKWLYPFGTDDNWYRCYHGTAFAPIDPFDAMGHIKMTKFKESDGRYGTGIYTSLDPTFGIRHGYTGSRKIPNSNKKIWFLLQCAVNPNAVLPIKPVDGDYEYPKCFVIAKTNHDIRPYGILIREYDDQYESYCKSDPYIEKLITRE